MNLLVSMVVKVHQVEMIRQILLPSGGCMVLIMMGVPGNEIVDAL